MVFADERRRQIAELIDSAGRARVSELSATFGVSPVTIRKDLLVLADLQRIVRTHGGAISGQKIGPEAALDIRERLQRAEKIAMANEAAGMVSDGQSIALDASTSALYLARTLRARESRNRLMVITNSIRSALELAGHPGISVTLLGGRVRWAALSAVGPNCCDALKNLNVQRLFMSCAGFTIGSGVTDVMDDEAQAKRAMVAAAHEVFLLADHTKWGIVSSATSCPTDQLTGVITDKEAPAEMVQALRNQGIDVRQVEPTAAMRP